jgi:hypothetical protein
MDPCFRRGDEWCGEERLTISDRFLRRAAWPG